MINLSAKQDGRVGGIEFTSPTGKADVRVMQRSRNGMAAACFAVFNEWDKRETGDGK